MREHATDACAALTEKEKETLRLIVRGHDTKSMASHLGLSVHTINERLRDARRKLSVSSSREAARLLLEREGADPNYSADKQIREAAFEQAVEHDGRPESGPGKAHSATRTRIGVTVMTFALGLLALAALTQTASAPSGAATSADAVNATIAASARDWLVLVDQGRWQESWAATAPSFRSLNTNELWATTSEKVRVPLSAVKSRVLLSQESVPAPPRGVDVVKFRTSFANKPNATEIVSLAQEDGTWRVVGYYIN